jgi:hypothetical protein
VYHGVGAKVGSGVGTTVGSGVGATVGRGVGATDVAFVSCAAGKAKRPRGVCKCIAPDRTLVTRKVATRSSAVTSTSNVGSPVPSNVRNRVGSNEAKRYISP